MGLAFETLAISEPEAKKADVTETEAAPVTDADESECESDEYEDEYEDECEDYEDMMDDERHETIRCKWTADGSKTLDEVVEKLEAFIQHIRELQAEGYELIAEMNDDYGHIWRHDKK